MAAGSFLVCCIAIAAFILTWEYGEARPVRDYDGVPSGVLRPISGVVPVSVPRRRLDAANIILKEIRKKVDKSYVSELDSSIRDDILQDALAPPECTDRYGIRDGVLKHIVRGTRDIVGAVVRDVQGLGLDILHNLPIIPDLPLAPNVINGLAEAVMYTICGAEDAVSDVVSGFVEGPEIFTKLIVNLLQMKEPAPLLSLPAGIVNITEVAAKITKRVVVDLALGVAHGVEDLADEVANGVGDVIHDVEDIASNAGVHITNVVNAVGNAVNMIGGGVGDGIGNILDGVKGGLEGVLEAL